MSNELKSTLIWLLGSAITFALCMKDAAITFSGGDFTPVGPDSFYHAQRILGAVSDPGSYYQFDAKIHAPEGSWLTWPWAYDLSVAWLVRSVIALAPELRPATVLAYVPPAWAIVNVFLIQRISSLLHLPLGFQLVAVLCFASLPLTTNLHAVGRIDHHFIEHFFTLATLCVGLWWLQEPSRVSRGLVLGLIVGFAPAFHTSLVILQIPISIVFFLTWSKGEEISRRLVVFFAAGVGFGVLGAVLPSGPFWDGQFSFYTLSGFHLYAAFANAAFLACLCRVPRNFKGFSLLIGIAALLVGPIAIPALESVSWFTQKYSYLDEIMELRPWFGMKDLPFIAILAMYSGLLVLLPVTLCVMVWRMLVTDDLARRFFYVFSAFGIAFMTNQVHFHYFGSFALYLPLLLALAAWRSVPATDPRYVWSLASVALILAFWPVVRGHLNAPKFPMDMNYYVTRDLYPRLKQACDAKPGVVLASLRDGHYIRYHTSCSVIANLMIVTRRHNQKVQLADQLLEKTPGYIRDHELWIDYVLVTKSNNPYATADAPTSRQLSHGLPFHLLKRENEFPQGYRLLSETTHSDGNPVGRVFQITR
jgi:hypothetical protein